MGGRRVLIEHAFPAQRQNFPTRHLLKDVRLFVDSAQAMGLATPALEGVGRILEQALERGLAEVDYSALYDVVDPR